MSQWGYRVCCGCGNNLCRGDFSRNQWMKGVGVSRCTECVRECIVSDSDGFQSVRRNNATRIEVDLDNICGEGTFRYCALGTYTGGQRTGQQCVVKYFKDSSNSFETDLDAVEQATRIITQWNQSGFTSITIRINFPEVWTVSGKQCFVEPYIDNFFKINSNSGWCTSRDDDMVDILQALSHYSYHISSGMFLLCDLQGGLYRDFVVLTDPVILSRRNRFGPTDLGPKGMSTFFYHHQCNQYCQSRWTAPRDQHNYFRATHRTTMNFRHDDDDDDDDEY